MRKQPEYLGLNRPKVRQSWNIHNLYNIARGVGAETMLSMKKTFFQQKWAAKSRTRGYHGDHISEKKWKRLFTRRPSIAVDMPAKYLAKHDGSEQAAGRGSGLATGQPSAESYAMRPRPSREILRPSHPAAQKSRTADLKLVEDPISRVTPTMQMTFAPLERRLDTAIFRALFASSVRQARQFVVHGAVKVNGKKVIHPAYQLNPGDMFQVEVDKVLHATAAPKTAQATHMVRRQLGLNDYLFTNMENSLRKAKSTYLLAQAWKGVADAEGASEAIVEESSAEAASQGSSESNSEGTLRNSSHHEVSVEDLRKMRLESALLEAKFLLRDKQEDRDYKWTSLKLRSFRDRASRVLSSDNSPKSMDDEQLLAGLEAEMRELKMIRGVQESNESAEIQLHRRRLWIQKALKVQGFNEAVREESMQTIGFDHLSPEEMRQLAEMLRKDSINPTDETKPYITPWEPRPYMKPFAFIPRYLEVNHNICAAIYMRHPVVRKGSAEVPTPFGYVTNQLAHNWYVQRT